MLAGLLVLATIAGVSSPTAPMRYKIDFKSSQEVDLSAAGAGKQMSELTASAWITVTMSDTAGGQLAHVVVDSLTATPTGMMAQQITDEAIAAAKGALFHLYIVNGKVQGTPKPSVESAALAVVAQSVTLLFPGAKTGLKVGETWTDTTRNDATTDAGTQTGSTVLLWKVLSMEGDAYVLEGAATGTMTAQQGGGELNISTKSTGTQKVTTTAKGPSKSGNTVMKVDATVVTSQLPDPIPVTGSTTVTVTAIP